MENKPKQDILDLIKSMGHTVRSMKTDKHISKAYGRRCHECKEKIKHGSECYTQHYIFADPYQGFDASFHVDCI